MTVPENAELSEASFPRVSFPVEFIVTLFVTAAPALNWISKTVPGPFVRVVTVGFPLNIIEPAPAVVSLKVRAVNIVSVEIVFVVVP